MSTDDAYVQADKVGISTDVSGIVKEVDVTENQHVEAGQVLYRLDPRQFQIALDNAKANLAQTALSIEAMKQDYQRMLSDVAAQQAQVESRSDQLRSRRDAPAQRHAFRKAMYDQAQLRARQPTRASSHRCAAAGAGAARQARRRSGHRRSTSTRTICRPRRRSTRRSASSTTPS